MADVASTAVSRCGASKRSTRFCSSRISWGSCCARSRASPDRPSSIARKIARVANAPCAFDGPEFPDHPLYNGNPWFLPVFGGWYRMRDRLDRLLA